MVHNLRAEIMLYGRGFRILEEAYEGIPEEVNGEGNITSERVPATLEVLSSHDAEVRSVILLPPIPFAALDQLMDDLEEFIVKKYKEAKVK